MRDLGRALAVTHWECPVGRRGWCVATICDVKSGPQGDTPPLCPHPVLDMVPGLQEAPSLH